MTESISVRYPIIPKPVKIEPDIGNFLIDQGTTIDTDHQNQWNAHFLQWILSRPTGYQLQIRSEVGNEDNSIIIRIDSSLKVLGDEGYSLTINEGWIKITSSSSKGIFYGIQTIRQLLPVEIESNYSIEDFQWRIPCVVIEDYPQYSWRGFLLDEARHFHGIENIKSTIDLMALHKLNKLHWHLTDDQGWRIEIKQYPKLTDIGSKRIGTSRTWMGSITKKHDGIPHSGFYSQEELQETVAYANERNITVIPEIDVPGHSSALITSYPHLSCFGDQKNVPTSFGIHKDILCAGKESTYYFIKNVLDEVMDIFPSPFIHLGGDEVPKTKWKKCPNCQNKIKNQNIKNEDQLLGYFFHRLSHYILSQDRQALVWNQVSHPELSSDVIIQFWAGQKKDVLSALRRGNYVINSTFLETYLDHSYTLTPLKRAYQFDPILPGVQGEMANYIIGLEAPLWTEWISNKARLDFQTYPRLTAIAETGWTQHHLKNYSDFKERLITFLHRLEYLDVRFAPEKVWDPPFYKRIFGLLTIAQAQSQISN